MMAKKKLSATKPVKKMGPTTLEIEEEDYGPIKSREERRCTDKPLIFVYVVYLLIVLGFLTYCILNADMRRIFGYYDRCGNFCGFITNPVEDPDFECTGADHRDKKYLYVVAHEEVHSNMTAPNITDTTNNMTITGTTDNINITGNATEEGKNSTLRVSNGTNGTESPYEEFPGGTRVCVESCNPFPNYTVFRTMCVPKQGYKENSLLEELKTDLSKAYLGLIASIFISIGLSILLVFLLKTHPRVMVWSILIANFLLLFGIFIHYMLNYKTHLWPAIGVFILTVILLIIIIALRKRIRLVIELFREAGNALAKMPLMFLMPIWIFFILCCVYAAFIFIFLWILSAGVLTYGEPNFEYKPNGIMLMTYFLNVFALLWTIQFVIGCQHMVIAGAVALWFFTRNKDELKAPLRKSAFNVVCFHLGSILFGSLIIALIQMLRFILSGIKEELKRRARQGEGSPFLLLCLECFDCIIRMFEEFMAYINRNAYIEISIFGFGFCKAGKRAFRVIRANLLNVAAINTAGDLVLYMGKLLVVIVTVLIAAGLFLLSDVNNVLIFCVICGIISYFFAHCFMSVFEMVIDSIFICFCEDKEMNDGSSTNPYYMSKNLMKFVEKSIEVLENDPGIMQKLGLSRQKRNS